MPDRESSIGRRSVLHGLGLATTGSLGILEAGTTQAAEHVTVLPYGVDMDDGTRLRGHVHVKEGATENNGAPVVLIYSPYWNVADTKSENAPSKRRALQRLVDEGFAVAAVSWRGTGDSEGCFQWGGPRDQKDVTTVVDDLARRPYCNGRVGMLGFSYDGFAISLALAGEEPDALEAAVPISSVIDLWSLFVYNGATRVLTPEQIMRDEQNAVGTRGGRYGADVATLQHLACPSEVDHDAAWAETTVTGVKNEFFRKRDLREAVYDSDVPMLVTSGLWVPNMPHRQLNGTLAPGDAHVTQIRGLFEEREPGTTRMLLGQHGHSWPTHEGFVDEVVTWFDHYLREAPRGDGKALGQVPEAVRPGVVEYEDDTGTWHTADQWPPEGDTETLYLGDRSLVESSDDAERAPQQFQSTNVDPDLSRERCDGGLSQAIYVSDPLAESVRLAGRATFDLTVESTLDGGNLCAVLFHTPGDGTCPDANAIDFNRMYADLEHWDELGEPKPFPTNEPTPVSFEGPPFATRIPEGHRIVLGVSGGSTSLVPAADQPLLTVHSGSEESRISLPVVEGDLETIESG